MEATLVVVKGKANKSRVVVKLPSVIGRSREADLRVAHPMVSRHHCQLYEENGLLKIRDLGSLNGVYVGNRRVTEAVLPPNSLFSIGPLTFRAEYEYLGVSSPAESEPHPSEADRAAGGERQAPAEQPAGGQPPEAAAADGPPGIAPPDGALPDFGQYADGAADAAGGDADPLLKTLPQVPDKGGDQPAEPDHPQAAGDDRLD